MCISVHNGHKRALWKIIDYLGSILKKGTLYTKEEHRSSSQRMGFYAPTIWKRKWWVPSGSIHMGPWPSWTPIKDQPDGRSWSLIGWSSNPVTYILLQILLLKFIGFVGKPRCRRDCDPPNDAVLDFKTSIYHCSSSENKQLHFLTNHKTHFRYQPTKSISKPQKKKKNLIQH